MRSGYGIITAAILLIGLSGGQGARILGIFPTPSLSHQLPYQAIMKALAAQGHQVTVISPDPLKIPVANYTDIDLSSSYEFWKTVNFNVLEDYKLLEVMRSWCNLFCRVVDMQLSTPQMQEFIKSKNNKFDLIVMEKIMQQSYYGLVHHVGSPPVVGIISMSGLSPSFSAFGNPNNPASLPNFFAPYSDHMNFWERMHNTYLYVAMEYAWHYMIFPGHEAVMRKHFGSAPPPISESEYNDSLLLLNNHWSMNYPRPLLPNVVELTGVHVESKINPLPKEIQNFLDGAKHGVIYFSLGSNLRSNQLPAEKVKCFLDAFSEIPQHVLWKWESDSLPSKPSNIMVRKWLPQQDILAHPNIRAYIMQGGIQSMQEAGQYGIPLIAIPFMSDQQNNAAKIHAAKIGIRLRFKDITKQTIVEALQKLINDTSYRDNMKKFAAVYREEMGEVSLKRAVWWIEYVLRHNGARHLRSAALDLSWYQYLLLDVIAVLVLALFMVLVVSYFVTKILVTFLKGFVSSSKIKTK